MSFDEILAATVEAAVARAVEPLRRELVALRRRQADPGPVTIAEAARRLGVSTKTVRRRLDDGALRVVGVGATRRVILPPVDDPG